MTTTEKTCFKCRKTLPLVEFYRHPKMADGHLNKCKECAKADIYESRHFKHRERVLVYDRERAKQPHRMEAQKKIFERWQQQNPERKAAQTKLFRAVKTGKVQRLPCFICGEKAQAHHPDYSRPLDVVWLCSAHHKQAHALARKVAA